MEMNVRPEGKIGADRENTQKQYYMLTKNLLSYMSCAWLGTRGDLIPYAPCSDSIMWVPLVYNAHKNSITIYVELESGSASGIKESSPSCPARVRKQIWQR